MTEPIFTPGSCPLLNQFSGVGPETPKTFANFLVPQNRGLAVCVFDDVFICYSKRK